jgi:Putative esterase
MWLESLGDWSWPGQGGGAAETLPPAWVPALPRRESATVAPRGVGAPARSRAASARVRRLITGTLLGLLAGVCVALAQNGQLTLSGVLGTRAGPVVEEEAPVIGSEPTIQSLPSLDLVSRDPAGSSILRADYHSPALDGGGSFLTYLPSGYDATSIHYPVVYMLPGDNQSDTAFLRIGLQRQLDKLIAARAVPPLIAVMIQGGSGANLWRNRGAQRYERYVLEVQELIDQMLPTVPMRDARAVVGDSMGGYGAMNVALSNPYRFAVVESWIGFFNGLEGHLRADAPVFARLGMHAFVYGGEEDHIADPLEDPPFAAALRAAGADAHGVIYPGEHSLQTVEAHLPSMLAFAGRALRRR